jgi:anti-anti-sigma factor
MSAIEITQRATPAPVTVFRLLERITLENFAEVEAQTREAHANGTKSLVLDLSRVDSLSSIGVRAIVVMHKILAKEGGNPLKLAGVSPGIREVLKISGITKFIEIYDTVDDAVRSFG